MSTNNCSNSSHLGPVEIHFERMVSVTAAISSSPKLSLNKGILYCIFLSLLKLHFCIQILPLLKIVEVGNHFEEQIDQLFLGPFAGSLKILNGTGKMCKQLRIKITLIFDNPNTIKPIQIQDFVPGKKFLKIFFSSGITGGKQTRPLSFFRQRVNQFPCFLF